MLKYIILISTIFFSFLLKAQNISFPNFIPGYSKSIELELNGLNTLVGYKVKNATGKLVGNTFYPNEIELAKNNGEVILANGNNEIRFVAPYLHDLRFNLFTDSIKIVDLLNYYVNIEGDFGDKKYFPLNEEFVELKCNQARVEGSSLHFDKKDIDSIEVIAIYKSNPNFTITKKLYIQKSINKEDFQNIDESKNIIKLNANNKKTKKKKKRSKL